MSVRARRTGPGAAVAASTAAALALRLVYARTLADDPLYLQPVLDAAAHLAWARGILDGTWPPAEAFFRAPGYAYFLALLLRLTGGDPSAAATVQLVLGAVVPAMTAWLGGRLFGRAAAWIAGLGAAAYPTLLFFDGQLLAPALAVPLGTAAVCVSVAALRSGGTRALVVASALWSLAAVVRAPLLLPGLALAPFAAAAAGGAPRRIARAGIVFAAVLAAPLAVTVRNAAVGDPVFLASQGGLNFHLGNGPAADGHSATFAEAPGAVGYRMLDAARRIAERDAGRPLGSAAVSRYWTARALRSMRDDPGRAARLLLKKCVLFCGAREIPNNHDLALFAERFPPLRLPAWGLWFPLALVGAAHAMRRREGAYVVTAASTIAIGGILFFVNARFRVPAAPLVVALGAGGAVALAAWARARRWRPLGVGLAAALAAAVLAHANPYRIPSTPWIGSYLLMAEAERDRGEPVRSLRWIERALEQEPGFYAARLAQVELLRDSGRRGEALQVAERVLAAQPGDPAMLQQAAILLDLDGRPAEALTRIDAALRAEPTLPGARLDRAIYLARLDRAAEADALLREVVRTGPPAESSRAAELLRLVAAGEIPPAGTDGAP